MLPTARTARPTVLPVSDTVNEMLFEREAPLLNHIQQRRLKRPHVDLQPTVHHLDGLQPTHLLIELFVGVDLCFELVQEGRSLWDALAFLSGVGFHLLWREDVPVQQELAQGLSAVLHVEASVLAEAVPVAAAKRHYTLHPLHEHTAQVRQIGHGLQLDLG